MGRDPSSTLRTFLADDQGNAAVEYSLIASLIGAALLVVLVLLGMNIGNLYTGVADRYPR